MVFYVFLCVLLLYNLVFLQPFQNLIITAALISQKHHALLILTLTPGHDESSLNYIWGKLFLSVFFTHGNIKA